MTSIVKVALVALLICTVAGTSLAASHKPADAQAFVKKAAVYLRENGREKAVAEYNNPQGKFVQGELYIIAYDFNGVLLANPHNLKMVGHNRLELKDADGKQFVKEFIKAGKKGSGWVSYKWNNPVSNKIERKRTYLEAVQGIILGCGIYQ
ncbi:MAG TPA: cache domain-containing protein [Geomonas sp.]|nr:cache domain-containing protein [Geomonas sp.]